MGITKLLTPGIRLKRWLLLFGLSLTILVLLIILKARSQLLYILTNLSSSAAPLTESLGGPMIVIALEIMLGFFSIALMIWSYRRLKSAVTAAIPETSNLVERIYKNTVLGDKPVVVVLGGGSGRFTLLQGLKEYTQNIVAIVSMSDSGGSTGLLRSQLGVLPPGDVRQSLVALSNSSELLNNLFQYRFKKGAGLKGHNLGNLLITGLIEVTGSFEKAIEAVGTILNIQGHVYPVTLSKTDLCAELENGTIIRGEANIDVPKHNPNLKIKRVFLDPIATGHDHAIQAIQKANVIVIGPGDLFTSIVPNILPTGIAVAIRESKAKKIFVCPLMTKYGETNDFCVTNFVDVIDRYIGASVLDYVIYNVKQPSERLIKKYRKEHSSPIAIDNENFKKYRPKFVGANVILETDIIRHHPQKLANLVLEIQ